MAKRRYRRYRRRRGRWSSNIQRLNLSGEALSGEPFGDTFTIAQNPVQSNTSVSQQYTVKNIEISGEIEATQAASIDGVTYYIMYVPEGYPINLDLPFTHPEWIMAYKYIGQAALTASVEHFQPPKIKTRLSRRLNTGDSIIFLFNGNNSGPLVSSIHFQGLVRWWTKAN